MQTPSLQSVLSAIAALTLVACSESSQAPQTGIFSDAPTKGIEYTSSTGVSGVTNANGEFQYTPGATVTFKLGSIVLGSINTGSQALSNVGGKLTVRPKDVAGVADETDEKALAVALLLQTAAGNPDVAATSIDVSAKSGLFSSNTTIDTLEKVQTLLASKSLTPQSMDKVTSHLLNAPSEIKTVEFTPTEVANSSGVVTLSDANRAIVYTTSSAKITYSDGSTKTFPLSFTNLFNNIDTDKTADGNAAAAIRDKSGNVLKDSAGKPYVAQTPDANSLMNVGGNLFLVSHFEYENSMYGKLPATMTLAKLDQNSSNGKLAVKAGGLSQVNFSSVNGLWIPCAGSRSPWNTHLGSEEYEPDARCEVDSTYAGIANGSCISMEYTTRMNNFRTLYGETNASPYHYGRVPEVTVNADGTSTVQKWYTLGRISREKVQFFGDSRTAIQGDDGTYTMLTMFVADKPKDLSSGTLYAAKWNQVSPAGTDGGQANLSWIKLGAATHAQIKAAVDAGVKFSDLFETSTAAAAGFTEVTTGHEVQRTEYLKLKSGSFAGVPIATLAAFLETRRYGAMLGATSEFEKMEGVAYNAKDNKAYVALTRMTKGMSDTAGDIKLKANNSGGVYVLNLKSAQKDSANASIDSSFVPVDMTALVIGEDQTADAEGNTSKIEKIASPDNVFFSERMRVLFIGEDSSRHVNNYLWAYHVDTDKLVRILSLPMGAESTGLQVVDNMNGFAYIMSNYQHAGDKNSTVDATYNRILPLINPQKAEVGYLGGLPAMR